ncbi:Fe(3+)-hydroxamate ABC transporter permease FhuB, partial [Paracoccus aestuarii]
MTGARAMLPLGAALALGLWLWAVRDLPWPGWPLDPQAMTLDQIRMGYGMMPRGVVALLAGAALGLAGAILQVVLRNPVADPTTLGISAGAQLALVLATVAAPDLLGPGRWPIAMAGG